MSKSQTKYWCFTLWFGEHESDVDIEMVIEYVDKAEAAVKSGTLTYWRCQMECGAKSKRFHLQGYLETAKRCRRSGLSKLFGKATHFESRKGTAKQADAYCRKGEELPGGRVGDQQWTFGELIEGKEEAGTARAKMITSMKSGMKRKELMEEHTAAYLSVCNGVDKYYAATAKPRDASKKPLVIVLWGPTAGGKSTKSRALAAEAEAKGLKGTWVQQPKGQWWDGYAGEEVVILEEFEGTDQDVPYQTMKVILDRGVAQVPIKGGMTQMSAVLFIIVSNKKKEDWYVKQVDKSALFRKLDQVLFMPTRPEFLDENGELLSKDVNEIALILSSEVQAI